MLPSTIEALTALNLRFYEAVAQEFHESRKAPWPGFGRVLAALPEPPSSVLDVGCGDGRFGAYLQAQTAQPASYLGVDYSASLLRMAAERRLGPAYDFVAADVVQADWEPAGRFALIVLFGLLHHIPSLELRKALLAKLAAHVAPGGSLAMTFWRLPEDPRFDKRVLTIEAHNASGATPAIPEADLEPGDTLLRWGQADAPPRYCHFANDAEIGALCATTRLQRVAGFLSDGRGDALNEYVVLRAEG